MQVKHNLYINVASDSFLCPGRKAETQIPACTHTHFRFVSVAAFSSSPQIVALWNGIRGPSGFVTMVPAFLRKMNSGVTPALLKLKVTECIQRESGSHFSRQSPFWAPRFWSATAINYSASSRSINIVSMWASLLKCKNIHWNVWKSALNGASTAEREGVCGCKWFSPPPGGCVCICIGFL